MQHHPHTPLGRVRTNAVQLPRAQDESQWALVSISCWESGGGDEKGQVTAWTWPLRPQSHPGLTRDPGVSIPIPMNSPITSIK